MYAGVPGGAPKVLTYHGAWYPAFCDISCDKKCGNSRDRKPRVAEWLQWKFPPTRAQSNLNRNPLVWWFYVSVQQRCLPAIYFDHDSPFTQKTLHCSITVLPALVTTHLNTVCHLDILTIPADQKLLQKPRAGAGSTSIVVLICFARQLAGSRWCGSVPISTASPCKVHGSMLLPNFCECTIKSLFYRFSIC